MTHTQGLWSNLCGDCFSSNHASAAVKQQHMYHILRKAGKLVSQV